MTTTALTVTDQAYALVFSGPGIIQMKGPGIIHVHIGVALPSVATQAYHWIKYQAGNEFSYGSNEFSYGGTENVYIRKCDPGSISLVFTELK